jgi:radical SAM superfamily enzyme YgiQ (UPF0313 family)
MKTLLMITPENAEINRFRAEQHNNFTQLTMPYLAGFVPEQYRIRLIDEYSESIVFKRFDLVAITVNTPNAPHVYQTAARFRGLGSWVVLGGPHVTLNPGEAASHADTVIIGEAEETWPQFLRDFLNGDQKKIYKCGPAPSLSGLPMPRRDLITGHRFTSGAVFATRGCPHHCSYCCLKSIYNQEFRTRPPREVVNEIKLIRNRYFVFWDDNFFADPDYTKALLKEMAPLKKRWAAQVTAHSCHDEELLTLAKKAGCIYLFLGLESFSEQGLRDANKSFNRIDHYRLIVDKLHRHGISVQAGVVFGFDSDTPEIFAKTLKACEAIGIDGVTPSVLTPFPGTPLYDQYKREARLLPVDWSYYNGKTRVAFIPKHMSPEDLLRGYDDFRGTFLSWGSILRRLLKSKVNVPYGFLMNWGYRKAYLGFKRMPAASSVESAGGGTPTPRFSCMNTGNCRLQNLQ